MEAWLNTLVPDALTQAEADWYLRTHGQAFNGYVDISLITIHNRDPKTGALYKGPARAKVTDKVLDIQRRLKENGLVLTSEADESTTGPASLTLIDPDGNPVLIDQHVD